MSRPQTVIATWLAGVLQQFEALGVPRKQLGEDLWAGEPGRWFATRQLQIVQVRRLWQRAARASGDPLLGLKVGSRLPPQALNVVSVLMMHSTDLREALAMTLRYQQLISNSGRFTQVKQRGGMRLSYQVTPCAVPMHASQVDSVFAGYLAVLERCVGSGFAPREIALPQPDLRLRPAYEAHFGCPVVLGANQAAFSFDAATLERPIVGADTSLLQLAQARADAMLQAQGRADALVDHVQAALSATGVSSATCESIARDLDMSTRTLQRRLAAAGTSFRHLVEAARMNEALRLLGEKRLPLQRISDGLGYADPSAFSHAVRSYWGRTPSELRREWAVA